MPSNKLVTVSVIIPVYNRQKMLNKALKSVLTQTVLPDEIIVVDDNSSKPIRIPKEYQQKNIILLRNEINLGNGASRNIGINHSSSNYCAFLDSDDYFSPRKLEFQKKIAEKYNSDFIYGSNIIVLGEKFVRANFKYISNVNSYSDLLNDFPFPNTSALFISKSFLDKIGGFDESLAACVDHDLWFKAANQKANFYGCKESESYFVQHSEDRVSLNVLRRIKSIPIFVKNRRKEGMNLLESFIFSNRYFSKIFINILSLAIRNKSFKIFLITSLMIFKYPVSIYFIFLGLSRKILSKLINSFLSKSIL